MLGALDRPQDMAPAYHYGVEGQLPWIDCASQLPRKATKERFTDIRQLSGLTFLHANLLGLFLQL